MKTSYKVLIGAAVGGAAFLIYKNWDDIKTMFKKKDDTPTGDGGGSGSDSGSGTSSGGKTEYQTKVEQLQGLLQVGIDGNAGKQTNGKLDYFWANFGKVFDAEKSYKDGYPELKANGKGVVSPSNIDYYISTLKANKSPRQLYWIGKKGKAETNARIAFGKKLYNLGATGSKVVSINTFTRPVRTLDASRGIYVPTGGNYTFSPTMTHLFSTYEIAGYNDDGFYILKYKSSPKNVTIVNPYLFKAI